MHMVSNTITVEFSIHVREHIYKFPHVSFFPQHSQLQNIALMLFDAPPAVCAAEVPRQLVADLLQLWDR